jgi:cysteinyl-tRNA synthetase
MPLRIYNSLTRTKERLSLQPGSTVKFFACGPTVYDYIHLGHARTFIAFDVITRYLEFSGYNLRYIINITDVADRLIERAQEAKRDPLELAREYERTFIEDMRALGIVNVERYERASDYIPQIVTQIKGLIDKGAAYQTETGVYFEVKKFPKFGQLSGQSREELGLRRLELCSSKMNPEDFSLWRRHDIGLRWQSPWGDGRPGWHVEDTAISMTHFGDTYDMHGGAAELIFPHHEAEIAQAEALTGKAPFVRFWLHAGLLAMKGRKMSKSLGNVIHVREALRRYTAAELRYYFASFHYRDQINISESALKRASTQLKRVQGDFRAFQSTRPRTVAGKEPRLQTLVKNAQLKFRKHMDNDFDTPGALSVLARLSRNLAEISEKRVSSTSKEDAERAFRRMADVLGILS